MARDKLIEVKEKDGESLETAYERTVPLAWAKIVEELTRPTDKDWKPVEWEINPKWIDEVLT